jgi:type I restriction enzyme M protein
VTRQELEALIKKASDKMRADDNTKLVTKYIEHLSWLLFLKAYEATEDEQSMLDPAYHRIIAGDYRWSEWTSKDWRADELISFINDQLLPHLRAINTTKAGRLIATLFAGVTAVMKSGFGLKEVIGIVDKIDFHAPQDVHTFSVVYESLLARLGRDAGWSGEFYTPRPIVRFMVAAVNPKLGQRVYDPASGSCGFLAEAFEHMRAGERTLADYEHLRTQTYFGQESGELPFLLGTMNMVLHGVSAPNLVRRNTLEQDIRGIPPQRQYDVILTNPPFGGRENPQVQQNFPARAAATEVLFLQHVMAFLAQNGQAAIVVPDGVLFREEAAFYHVRRRLVEDFKLRAIVRLPPGVFPYATATRTNLLFVERAGSTDVVRYYRVSTPPGAIVFGKTRPISDEDLAGALRWVQDGEADQNGWEVTVEAIRGTKYDLDLLPPDEANELNDTLLGERIEIFASRATALANRVAELRAIELQPSAYRFDRVTKLGPFIEERGRRSKSIVPNHFLGVTNAGGLAPFKGDVAKETSRYRRVEVGDFVYNPMRINVGSIALCRTPEEGGYASPDYFVFRLKPDAPITAEYLLLYLQSPMGRHQIDRNAQGSVRSRLYFENLCNIKIPLPADKRSWDELVTAWDVHTYILRSLAPALTVLLDGAFRWSPNIDESVAGLAEFADDEAASGA